MSRYDGLIIPRSYSEYINKTDAATIQQALQLSGVLSAIVAAGDNKAVKSSAVYEALTNYINKTDAATLQQALQLPGVLSGAVAAGDNKAVTSNAVNDALKNYSYVNVYTTSTGAFDNKFGIQGIYEIFITDILDTNKWIKLIYSNNTKHYEINKIINRTLDVKDANALGTIVIQGGSKNYKSFSIFYKL